MEEMMAQLKYRPVSHDQEAFLEQARKRKGFQEAYEELGDEYALSFELLGVRSRAPRPTKRSTRPARG
jgi:hypothetical protein